MVLGSSFVIADQAAVSEQPAEGAFHYPAARQHHEPAGVVVAFDDGHGQAQRGLGPDDQPARVAAVGPDQSDGGEPLPQQGQQRVGTVAVLDAGRGDEHHQQQPEGCPRRCAAFGR